MEMPHWATMDMTFAVVAAIISALLLSWISRRLAGGRLRLPPGPRGFPILGAIPHLGLHPHQSFYELAKLYGPVMFMKFGAMPVLVVNDAESAKSVLQTNDHIFASRPRLTIPSVISYNHQDLVFAPLGPHWRHLRKICNIELLAANKLNRFSMLIEKEISATVQLVLQKSAKSETMNLSKTLSGMTMNVITQMMWNKRHLNLDLTEARNRFEEVFEKVVVESGSNGVIDLLPDFLPSVANLALKFVNFDTRGRVAHEALDKFLEELICEREEEVAKHISANAGKEDFLDALLKITNKNGTPSPQEISFDSLKATLTDMLIAGRDSSSTTMGWCMSELMRHPAILKRVQDELTAVVGMDRMVQVSDIPNLKYLHSVIKETLRRRNPASFATPHYSTADCKVLGYDVPAHTMLLVNFFAIHHDEKVWEDPFQFNPDRFLNSDLELGGRNFNYLPFGAGRRMCVGMNFASSVLHQGLAQMLHCIDWTLPEGTTPETLDMAEFSGLFTSRKNPLYLVAKPRLNPQAYSPLS